MALINVPNSITFFRALLLIPFMLFLKSGELPLALACFGAIVALDKADGISARLMNQKTKVGELFDTTLDWVSLLLAFSGGIYFGYIDSLFVPYLISSFALVALAKTIYTRKTRDTSSTWAGKINIGLAYIAVLSYLAQFPYQDYLFWCCIAGTACTGVFFFVKAGLYRTSTS